MNFLIITGWRKSSYDFFQKRFFLGQKHMTGQKHRTETYESNFHAPPPSLTDYKTGYNQAWTNAMGGLFLPPYSPDLNLLDYSVWSILEAKACAKPHKSLHALRRSLEAAWETLTLETVGKLTVFRNV